MSTEFETEQFPDRVTFDQAYNRFLANYLVLGGPGADLGWFVANVGPLLALAGFTVVQEPHLDLRPFPPSGHKRRRGHELRSSDEFINHYSMAG